MERARSGDARDARSIDPMESFDPLYRKVRHCTSRASPVTAEQQFCNALKQAKRIRVTSKDPRICFSSIFFENPLAQRTKFC